VQTPGGIRIDDSRKTLHFTNVLSATTQSHSYSPLEPNDQNLAGIYNFVTVDTTCDRNRVINYRDAAISSSHDRGIRILKNILIDARDVERAEQNVGIHGMGLSNGRIRSNTITNDVRNLNFGLVLLWAQNVEVSNNLVHRSTNDNILRGDVHKKGNLRFF